MWNICSEWWKILSALIWRLMEIHVFKVVVFVIIMVAVYDVSTNGWLIVFSATFNNISVISWQSYLSITTTFL